MQAPANHAIVKDGVGGSLTADPVLAKYAAEIRRLGKRVKEDIIAIGRYLDDAREHAGRGAWLIWLEAEFGWSDQTAYRYIHLYQGRQNSESFPEFHKLWNSDLPISALQQLAAPSTPQEARVEVAERIEAGEKVSCATVTEVIAQAKGKGPATNTPGAEDDFTPAPEPEWDRAATAPGDQALLGFTASVLELKRRISRQQPSRFAKTSVAGSDLVELAEFLGALAQFKGCEPAQTPKRKSDKPFKHTLNLEANSARNGRGHHSRQ